MYKHFLSQLIDAAAKKEHSAEAPHEYNVF